MTQSAPARTANCLLPPEAATAGTSSCFLSLGAARFWMRPSTPGIFAVGDVRSGSVKRAAAAIWEGSMAVRLVYNRLQSTGTM
jgi:hypothetical protein